MVQPGEPVREALSGGIGIPRHPPPEIVAEGSGQSALYGARRARLDLPALEVGAVVLEGEAQGPHDTERARGRDSARSTALRAASRSPSAAIQKASPPPSAGPPCQQSWLPLRADGRTRLITIVRVPAGEAPKEASGPLGCFSSLQLRWTVGQLIKEPINM